MSLKKAYPIFFSPLSLQERIIAFLQELISFVICGEEEGIQAYLNSDKWIVKPSWMQEKQRSDQETKKEEENQQILSLGFFFISIT